MIWDLCLLYWLACVACVFFFSSRRRHTRFDCDWSSDVCSSDLAWLVELAHAGGWALAIGLAAGTLVIGMVLAVLLRGHGRRQQQLDPRTPRQVAAIQLYTRMLRILETRGLPKSPGATPLEFARQVAREWRDAAPFVRPLTDLYYQVRFGQASLSSDETQKVHDLLARLRAVRR